MPRHPTVYAEMLRDFMRRHQVNCWLVNTGWSGGPYGTGQRISLRHTRAMLHAALEGELAEVPFQWHAEFGLMIPKACPGVPSGILDPRATWSDPTAYERTAREVAKRFEDNFAHFSPHVGDEVEAGGIHPQG
jgi:phosphoenolpyruvate carboxykinase (ATP)